MHRFIIYASLSALLLIPVALGDGVMTVHLGYTAELRMDYPQLVERCVVITNTGSEFTFYPAADNLPSHIRHHGKFSFTCTMALTPIGLEDIGEWTIKAYTTDSSGVEKETILRQTLRVQQAATIVPSANVKVLSGSTAAVGMAETIGNLKSCIVTNPKGEEIDVLGDGNESEGMERFRQCGIRFTAKSGDSGNWKIVANTEEFWIYSGNFDVTVLEESTTEDSTPTVTYLALGSSATITVGPSTATYCQLERPDGVRLPLQTGPCSEYIPVVTSQHEGVWIAYSGIPGQLDLHVSRTNVSTYDNRSLNSTVTWTETNQINLLCQFRAVKFSFCHFTRPDGLSMHVPYGVGNDKYVYYGIGTEYTGRWLSHSTELGHDCGLTILNPAEEDYGAWRCIVGGDGSTFGKMLQVTSMEKRGEIHLPKIAPSTNVYAKHGDPFTIKCAAEAELSYCWMSSPNGTTYSVSDSGSHISHHLRYEGSGLSLGECGAVVEAADDTHYGDWGCHMGVSEGPELSTTVSVVITDSLLLPDETQVELNPWGVHLNCRILPGHDDSIDYCRWMRPDGLGLHHNEDSRYRVDQSTTHCGLFIQQATSHEDLGPWTCVAGLTGSSAGEAWALIEIYDESHVGYNSSLMFGLIGMGVVILVAIPMAYVGYRMRLAKKRPPLPPKYSIDP